MLYSPKSLEMSQLCEASVYLVLPSIESLLIFRNDSTQNSGKTQRAAETVNHRFAQTARHLFLGIHFVVLTAPLCMLVNVRPGV